MKRPGLKNWLVGMLSAVLMLVLLPSAAFADEDNGAYVLMNIPYAQFYAAEGVSGVDAVSTATVKTYNQNMAGGSYHEGNAADTEEAKSSVILGVTYPVYVSDVSVLEGLKEIKSDDTGTITVASGKSAVTTKDVEGADLLFAAGDYAYMVMDSEPGNYKILSGTSASDFEFSAVKNGAEAGSEMTATVTYGGHYTDVVVSVEAEEITSTAVVNAIVITAGDEKYALRHVEDEWKKTELGWNWDKLDGKGLAGKTITNITYYIKDADEDGNVNYNVYSYDVNVSIKTPVAGEVTAEFTDSSTVELTGLPADITAATATVSTKVGRGETATVIANSVAISDGKIALTEKAVGSQTYTVKIVSENYADISVEATTPVYDAYIVMNIPYDKFYNAEGVSGVDAVSTATVKTYNQNMAGGSYHEGNAADVDEAASSKILGVTYPVYVEDDSVLKGFTRIRSTDAGTITVASGKSAVTTKDVEGADLLFAAGDYAYMILDSEPGNYKTLSGTSASDFVFSAVKNGAEAGSEMTATVTYGGHYTDVVVSVEAEEITSTAVVNAIVITAGDEKYALRHVEDEWKKTELGWNWDKLDGKGLAGKTITNITYYIKDADEDGNVNYNVYSYDVNVSIKTPVAGEVTAEFTDSSTVELTGLPADITAATATVSTKVGRGETATVIANSVAISDGKIALTEKAVGSQTYTVKIVSENYADISVEATTPVYDAYIVMNIPYDKFYNAEGVSGVDAVSTATVKTYNQNMAGGSYHEGNAADVDEAASSKILGVTYPVYVEDDSVLKGFTRIRSTDAGTITVASGKSAVTTKDVEGADLLFAAGDYAYMILDSEPGNYKTLSGTSASDFVFSAVKNGAEAGSEMTATVTYGGHYTDVVVSVEAEEITSTAVVNAIVITAGDEKYALRHVEDEWKKTELGWNWDKLDGKGLAGKTITNITYYIKDADEDGNVNYNVYSYDVNVSIKTPVAGEVTAEFTDSSTVELTGLPADITAATATVSTKVGRGETATVIANSVAISDGKIALTEKAVGSQTYTVKIVSENYADISVEATTPVYDAYIVMNIPYDKFYNAEGVSGVDAVSTATVKTYNQNMAGGSYHEGNAADVDEAASSKILGVTYPVYVEDDSVLKGFTRIRSTDAGTITVASGKSAVTTKDVEGADLLFAAGDYAYMILDSEPGNYKTLSGTSASDFVFSAVKNGAEAGSEMTATVTYGGHYTDVVVSVEAEEITSTAVVNAIVITAGDEKYALRHVEDEWKKTELGWNWDKLDGKGLAGKTITNITYYIKDADSDGNVSYKVYSYEVNASIKKHAEDEVTAEFSDESTMKVTGLPADIGAATATVATKVGRGETATVIANSVAISDGKIALAEKAEGGQTYTVKILSSDYADINLEVTASADLFKAQEDAEEAIAAAEKIDATAYPAENAAAVKEAIAALQAVLAKEDATAEEIAAAVTALNDAIAAAETAKAEAEKQEETKPSETTPSETTEPTTTPTAAETVKKGEVYTIGNLKYKVTKADMSGKGTVAVTGAKKKTLKTLKVPATVTIKKASFKVTAIASSAFKGYKKLKTATIGKNVTAIGKNAFNGDSKLKTITINSSSLKSVGKNAIKGIAKKAVIKVPSKKLKAYKKLFKSSTGFKKKTMKIKKK